MAEEPTIEQLKRRLERERKALRQAEAVTEEATSRLYTTLEELKSLNQAMRDFVAVAAHDLRSPLSTISGFATLLTENWSSFDDEERLRQVQVIERSANSLINLAEDLLTVSRIEAGALDTRKQVIELKSTIEQAMDAFLTNSSEVKVRIADDVRVEADPRHVERIVVNFVNNALKYGDPPVEVCAKRDGEWVEIRVTDNGDGVPGELIPRLFGRFARGLSASQTKKPGAGLGLSIVRGLALANGGEVWYEPNEPRGSVFGVRLPSAA
jgi:signal transduction histidine kinase